MKFYQIDTLAVDAANCDKYAYVDQGLNELGLGSYMPSEGDPIEQELLVSAPLTLKICSGPAKLATLIGNTHAYLLLAKSAKECIEQICQGVRIEYVPFTLYNRKNLVYSTDYFVINPIGTLDCIHREASDIEYYLKPGSPSDGKIININRLALDAKKLEKAPALFRVQDQCHMYIVNQILADEFVKQKFTNIELIELPCI